MNEQHVLTYGSSYIEFDIIRRDRKTLEIAVYPDSSVQVVAPLRADIDKIYAKVEKRAAWIQKQQSYFQQFAHRKTPRNYISGETHLYLGKQYKLKVIQHIQKRVLLKRGMIIVQSHYASNPKVTQEMLDKWYKHNAQIKFHERLQACLKSFPNTAEFTPNNVLIRDMSSRWGSMTNKGNIVLNKRLIKAPLPCIDYVVTHELCHMRFPRHDKQFYDFLDSIMPDWERRKYKLERSLV